MDDEIDIKIISSDDTPDWAKGLRKIGEAIGEIEGSGSSLIRGKPVCWSLDIPLVDHPARRLSLATCEKAPANVLGLLGREDAPLSTMASARSLCHRSEIKAGTFVPATFADLAQVSTSQRAPGYELFRGDEVDEHFSEFVLGVPCAWQDLSLDEHQRRENLLRRAVTQIVPLDWPYALEEQVRAADAMLDALRQGVEPMLSNAAWALVSLCDFLEDSSTDDSVALRARIIGELEDASEDAALDANTQDIAASVLGMICEPESRDVVP